VILAETLTEVASLPNPQGLGAALTTELLRSGSIGLTAIGLFISVWSAAADQSGPAYRYWARYTSSLERKLRPQFIWTKGSTIALGQVGAVFALLLAQIAIGVPFWGGVLIFILAIPTLWVEKMRKERVELIEKQLDGFILALSNALKTTPSIGAAFNSISSILQDPTRQEIELCVKEIKVGSTLDQALLHMAARVGSRQLDTALSSVLIGRQVGGNLPKVLEQVAATLREMARLEGVVRTKTAEGKMQLWVLGALPAALFFALNTAWPGYFIPMTKSITGYIVLFMCGASWVSALVLARKVLSVDI
jgi:tight adherence protein B